MKYLFSPRESGILPRLNWKTLAYKTFVAIFLTVKNLILYEKSICFPFWIQLEILFCPLTLFLSFSCYISHRHTHTHRQHPHPHPHTHTHTHTHTRPLSMSLSSTFLLIPFYISDTYYKVQTGRSNWNKVQSRKKEAPRLLSESVKLILLILITTRWSYQMTAR